jgi:hypothetical protein
MARSSLTTRGWRNTLPAMKILGITSHDPVARSLRPSMTLYGVCNAERVWKRTNVHQQAAD